MEIRPEPLRASRRPPVHVLVAVLALAVAGLAVAASLASPGALNGAPALGAAAAAGASAAPAASPDASSKPGRGNGRGWGMVPGFGFFGGGPGGPGAIGDRVAGSFLADIRITAIDGTKVSLQSANGWSRTVDASGVAITRAGATISVADLKVGDRIAVSETRNADGTFTTTKLMMVLDQLSGTVSKIDAASITVDRPGGKAAVITTSDSTVYRRAGQTIARSDIAVGERLTAEGASGSDGALTAVAVDVQADVVFGTVSKKSGDTLTITTAGGGSATVKVTGSTTYQVAGKASAALADIALSDVIFAQGVKGADGVLTASSLRAGAASMMGPTTRGWGGFGRPKGSPSPSASAGTTG